MPKGSKQRKPCKLFIPHREMDKPFLEIQFLQTHLIKDKELYRSMIDDVYESVFKYINFLDFGLNQTYTSEAFSFYYIPDEKTDANLLILYQMLKNIIEFCPPVSIYWKNIQDDKIIDERINDKVENIS